MPELELTALHLQHNKTGGEYLHLAKDDTNNVFSIGFKTNPPDRTGVPHILEHLTLCGSKQYQVRDPFFKMMPRSLNNFMNAMTYPDHTVYPFATTNHQDFKNLMSVYVDATLHPLLREHDFSQEGWRIGPQNPHEPTSDENAIGFKGVVYNEMKGNMSNADYLFRTRWQDNVFPSIHDSGGDPEKMTDLTHDNLKRFQAEHYNPSNSKIMTYGNVALEEHLKFLGPQFDQFEKAQVDQELKMPISLEDESKTVTVKGPYDPLYPKDQQYKASVTWTMNETSDVLETFSLGIISSLLLEGFSAPFYRNTIEVGWGASYTPNTGYDPSAKTGLFTMGLSGLRKHDVVRLKDGLQNTLSSIMRKGFDHGKVDGRLHQIELGLKHKTAHFGMGVTTRLQDGWFNGTDPFDAISPEEVVTAFRNEMEDPHYLVDLLEKYWMKDETFTFIMEPSEAFAGEQEAEEASRLQTKIDEVKSRYSSAEEATKDLEKRERELTAVQESSSAEDISCLPTIHTSDIPRTTERKTLRHATLDNGHTIQWREAPTNGLTYFRAIQPLQDLPDDLRVYLPLFSAAIQRLGTKNIPLEQLEDLIRLQTGGISFSHHASTSPLDITRSTEGLALSATALDRNVPSMFELLRTMILSTDFTKRGAADQIAELIKGTASTALNDVSDSGHAYARRFAEAGLAEQARLTEETDGLTQVRLMMDLASRPQRAGLNDVIDKLKVIQTFALTAATPLRIALTCGAESSTANERALQDFLGRLPAGADAYAAPTAEAQIPYPVNAKSFFPLPYQVYYSALATRTVPYVHPDSAPLAVLAQLLTHKRLHPEIREKGGAYGASAYAGALRGTFGFATYRDPNPERSLTVMRESGAWAVNQTWIERDLEEAKLSVFQSVDAPESVSEEGMARFLHGVDESMEQERRERLLDVSLGQLKDVAEKYVAGVGVDETKDSNTAVLGARADFISGENGWTEMPMGSAGAGAGGGGDTISEEREDGFLVL